MDLNNLSTLLDEALSKLPAEIRADFNKLKTQGIKAATDESKTAEQRKIDVEYLTSKMSLKYGTEGNK